MSAYHIPVMPKEVVEFLNPKNGETIVDCTLGGGGHAQAVLEKSKIPARPARFAARRAGGQNPNVKLIGIDQDEEALRVSEIRLSGYRGIRFVHDNFSNVEKIIDGKVDGFLFDLGVSSHQIDESERGFSFRTDGPLDMRMDKGLKLTAGDIINSYPKEELERIFKEYGEERFAKRIANKIQDAKSKTPIKTTFQLKEIVEKAIPIWKKRESVARIFQALRIAVNSELENLHKGLNGAVKKLNRGGRIVVISYHSLEDRIVKRFFRGMAKDGILKAATKKPLIPRDEETEKNPRAKSAKLRCAEKI